MSTSITSTDFLDTGPPMFIENTSINAGAVAGNTTA